MYRKAGFTVYDIHQEGERSSIDIINNEELIMLRAFTVPLANLRSRNEYKKFRPIFSRAMLSLIS